MSLKKLLHPWFLPILSGVFIGTSYIPFPPWAALFCFVPLWLFWQQQTQLKPVILGGLVTAFTLTLIGFNWMTYLLHEFAHLPWPVAVVGMLVYAVIAHLFVPLAGLIWYVGQTKFNWPKALSLALMALITCLSEAYSFTLFDWNFGYSWYGANVPIYQWAEIIGFKGLSAATLLANLPLYYAWQNRTKPLGKVILTSVCFTFVLLNLSGLWLKNRLPPPDAALNALLVQGNVGHTEKLAAEFGKAYPKEVLRRYIALTDQAVQAANTTIDFAMWPETAFPSLMGGDFQFNELPKSLSHYLAQANLALITGAYGIEESSRLITNSMFVLDNKGQLVPPHYSKTILLAFGEYIPGEAWFPQLRDWLPATGQFARGPGPSLLLNLNDYKMGAQICYESLFPQFSRDLANLGAQFIVNATNDSWYGDWQEPYQHLYMTLARGVEFRRPVLRVTNTGISTVSLASGDILQRSPMDQAWTGLFKVPYLKNPPTTFYQRWFWLIPCLLWGTLFTLLIFGLKKPTANAEFSS
ncbi:MAG: apolipoprotein N-acyltransferase [Methylococcaceae bacterium]|jgi:apolipoprotein N-acyltransferase